MNNQDDNTNDATQQLEAGAIGLVQKLTGGKIDGSSLSSLLQAGEQFISGQLQGNSDNGNSGNLLSAAQKVLGELRSGSDSQSSGMIEKAQGLLQNLLGGGQQQQQAASYQENEEQGGDVMSQAKNLLGGILAQAHHQSQGGQTAPPHEDLMSHAQGLLGQLLGGGQQPQTATAGGGSIIDQAKQAVENAVMQQAMKSFEEKIFGK